MKRILTGAALNSHFVRVWNTIKKRYENMGSARINYITHALLLAVQWGEILDKEKLFDRTDVLLGILHELLPEDPDIPAVTRYLRNQGWEKSEEALIFDEGGDVIYASTITDLFHTYNLMPLRWKPHF